MLIMVIMMRLFMELGIALDIIRKSLMTDVIESRHIKEQYIDRTIGREKILNLIRESKILGILEQDDDLYKVWFHYDKYKDLNIIVRILPNHKLKLITFFPCLAERRRRK